LFRSEFPNDTTSPISPGKRKFDSSSGDSPESSRWGSGASIRGENGVNILEREIGGSEPEEGSYVGVNEQPEVILGIDPSMDGGSEVTFRGQEMQERRSLRMPSNRPQVSSTEARSTVDGMDLDHVVEDDHVAEESAAVKLLD
jgi:hypothetical protein